MPRLIVGLALIVGVEVRSALFEYFHNATSQKDKIWTNYSDVCWRTGSSKNIEAFCRLCRCFCQDKPVESVILSGRIKSLLSPLLFKNLVFQLFLKYSFSHMVSTFW